MVDGGRLLALFGVLMVIVGLAMSRPRKSGGNPDVALTRENMLAARAVAYRQSALRSAYCRAFSVSAAAS